MCVSVSVAASEKTYVIENLSSAAYTLWMTASTPVRKGPTESWLKVKFTIHREWTSRLEVFLLLGKCTGSQHVYGVCCVIVMVPEGMHVTIPLVAVLVSMVILILMCLYQSPAVKQRSEGSS